MNKIMIFRSLHIMVASVTAATLGIVVGTISSLPRPLSNSAIASAQTTTSFPDTENYWGQPFIQALAERDIVTGYPDNTFRPEQPVERDEFAAILRQAFSQAPERQISSGSVYKDVPEGYWAASAIAEAYEMGFMRGYPGGEFRPNQPVTKVEVLTSLARNLQLPPTTTSEAKPVAPVPAATVQQSSPVASQRPIARRRARPLLFPLAFTSLMQPLMAAQAQATSSSTGASSPAASNTTPASTAANNGTPQRPVSLATSDYYEDADQIPQYAVDAVVETTAAGIVVNYPNPRVLNPTQPASRGEVAALIHQALVHQGRMSPLPENETASSYIVNR